MKVGDVVRAKGIPGPVMRVSSKGALGFHVMWFTPQSEVRMADFAEEDLEPADAGSESDRERKLVGLIRTAVEAMNLGPAGRMAWLATVASTLGDLGLVE